MPCFTLLRDTTKLFALFLPYVTERIYQGIFDENGSIHRAQWPEVNGDLVDETADSAGEALLEIATAVRRYKSEAGLSLGSEIPVLMLKTADAELANALEDAKSDIMSVTRAQLVEITDRKPDGQQIGEANGRIAISIVQ